MGLGKVRWHVCPHLLLSGPPRGVRRFHMVDVRLEAVDDPRPPHAERVPVREVA